MQKYHGAGGLLAVLPAPLPMKAAPSRGTPAVKGHPKDGNREPTKPTGAAIECPVKRKDSHPLPRPFFKSPRTGRERDGESEKSEDNLSPHTQAPGSGQAGAGRRAGRGTTSDSRFKIVKRDQVGQDLFDF